MLSTSVLEELYLPLNSKHLLQLFLLWISFQSLPLLKPDLYASEKCPVWNRYESSGKLIFSDVFKLLQSWTIDKGVENAFLFSFILYKSVQFNSVGTEKKKYSYLLHKCKKCNAFTYGVISLI